MKIRPLIFLSAFSFAETLFVLLFPGKFSVIITAIIALIAIFCFFLIKKKHYFFCLFFSLIFVFSALNPYLRYLNIEKNSQELIVKYNDKKDTVYTASVEECRTYSSFSHIFVTLKTADGNDIGFSPKARLGCFSGEKLSENDIIVFSGIPQSIYDIKTDDFDTATYLRGKEVFIDFPSVNVISSSPAEKAPFFQRLRDYTSNVFFRFIPQNHNFEASSVCFAMFAGDKTLIPDDISDNFSRSGLTHILCVSGMHLAILSGSIYLLLTILSVHKKAKCIIIILLCVFYTAFAGFSLSTVRSCIMCCMCYAGMMLGKKTDGYASLFLSLFLICTFSPYSVFDISLLLSFTATLGILCISEIAPKYDGKNKIIKHLCGLSGLLYFNIGAVFFTLPISAFFFKEVSVMSIISTLVVSFAVEFLLVSLLLLLIISPLSFFSFTENILFGIGSICRLISTFIIKIAESFSSFRYALCEAVFPELYIFIFIIFVCLLTAFIVFDIKNARYCCLFIIIFLSICFSFFNLHHAVYDDGQYKVFYYRKNEDNRQLNIKLGKEGYLLINADNSLCTDDKDAPFDRFHGNNYLFIIPDKTISETILADNIKSFNKRFGIKKIFLPQNIAEPLLWEELSGTGIEIYLLENNFNVGDFSLSYTNNDFFYITVDDGKTKTGILFGNDYDKDIFDNNCDICAFFTRKTKNQFDLSSDTPPKCKMFFTRLKKGEEAVGMTNTFGEKSITIKG